MICRDETKWSKQKYQNWLNNKMTQGLLSSIETFNNFCETNNIECKIEFGFMPPKTCHDTDGKTINYPIIHMFIYGPDSIKLKRI